MKTEKNYVRCVCGTVTYAVLNFDRCSKCEFPLIAEWGCQIVVDDQELATQKIGG